MVLIPDISTHPSLAILHTRSKAPLALRNFYSLLRFKMLPLIATIKQAFNLYYINQRIKIAAISKRWDLSCHCEAKFAKRETGLLNVLQC